jgi:hypothetical protein
MTSSTHNYIRELENFYDIYLFGDEVAKNKILASYIIPGHLHALGTDFYVYETEGFRFRIWNMKYEKPEHALSSLRFTDRPQTVLIAVSDIMSFLHWHPLTKLTKYSAPHPAVLVVTDSELVVIAANQMKSFVGVMPDAHHPNLFLIKLLQNDRHEKSKEMTLQFLFEEAKHSSLPYALLTLYLFHLKNYVSAVPFLKRARDLILDCDNKAITDDVMLEIKKMLQWKNKNADADLKALLDAYRVRKEMLQKSIPKSDGSVESKEQVPVVSHRNG